MAQPRLLPLLLGAALHHPHKDAAADRTKDSRSPCFTPHSSRMTLTQKPSKQICHAANLILREQTQLHLHLVSPSPQSHHHFSKWLLKPAGPWCSFGQGTANLCLLITVTASPQSPGLPAKAAAKFSHFLDLLPFLHT